MTINSVVEAVGARVLGENSGVDFARIVQLRGEGVVSSYLNGNDPSNPHRSVKNLIEETTHEYGGRFLLELLQNAHDAHGGDGSGGQVLMQFDRDEGLHGVLYVADRGRGFDDESFDAICKLAQSSKTVGEGIGNKGVGFKSVLQICEWPEIYSSDPVAPDRDGYCFRFATVADLKRMVPDDEAFRRVREDVSAYTVPVPITTSPKAVRDLRDQGFRTVMRLPLRSAVAAGEVEKRFVELERNSAPVMLFLRRMRALRLRRSGGADPDSDVILSREVRPLSVAMAEKPFAAEVVTIDGQQRFLVVSRDVDPAELRAAVRESVDAELLNSKWLDWTTPTHVAAAVSLDSASKDRRLYTYLPMGPESAAPFPRHLHAPFHTDFARRSLIRDHPLNSMLFDAVAALALDANKLLLSGSLTIPDAEPRSVAVDLVSWWGIDSEHLARAADRQPVLLPTATGGVVALADAWLWPRHDCQVLTPVLAERAAGMACLFPGLGGERLERLRQTARALGESIDLTAERLAEAVEVMVGWCARDRLPIPEWNALYDDIAVLFERGADAWHLAGRRILLREDRELTPCLEQPDPASRRPGSRPRL
ncbi:MAG: ATP-binding protein, partial [Actinomycetota bacterium]